MMGVHGVLSHEEYALAEAVRRANIRLRRAGFAPPHQPGHSTDPDVAMWANIRRGAMMRLVQIRDREAVRP